MEESGKSRTNIFDKKMYGLAITNDNKRSD